jgi:hypothetical protein
MKKGYALASLFLAGVCYSYVQLKDVECKTYCKTAIGYLSGIFVNGQCWCADKISVEKMNEKKVLLPRKNMVSGEL